MIARHSLEQSAGNGEGVEIVLNEPCFDTEHGDGQFTEKRIYLSRCLYSFHFNFWKCIVTFIRQK